MISNYMSVEELAEKWNVSVRYVQNLCKKGRIEGARKFGKVWAIPEKAERPPDLRVKTGLYKNWRKKCSFRN